MPGTKSWVAELVVTVGLAFSEPDVLSHRQLQSPPTHCLLLRWSFRRLLAEWQIRKTGTRRSTENSVLSLFGQLYHQRNWIFQRKEFSYNIETTLSIPDHRTSDTACDMCPCYFKLFQHLIRPVIFNQIPIGLGTLPSRWPTCNYKTWGRFQELASYYRKKG